MALAALYSFLSLMGRTLEKKIFDLSPASANDTSFVYPRNSVTMVARKMRSFVFLPKTHFNQFLA
jgi:hypothetical protein